MVGGDIHTTSLPRLAYSAGRTAAGGTEPTVPDSAGPQPPVASGSPAPSFQSPAGRCPALSAPATTRHVAGRSVAVFPAAFPRRTVSAAIPYSAAGPASRAVADRGGQVVWRVAAQSWPRSSLCRSLRVSSSFVIAGDDSVGQGWPALIAGLTLVGVTGVVWWLLTRKPESAVAADVPSCGPWIGSRSSVSHGGRAGTRLRHRRFRPWAAGGIGQRRSRHTNGGMQHPAVTIVFCALVVLVAARRLKRR